MPVKTLPPLDEGITKEAVSYDLAVVNVRLPGGSADRPKYEDSRTWALVTVQNLVGVTPCFLIATTGDSTTPDRLIKSELMRLGRGESREMPLQLYTNPAHVEGGVFSAFVWLGTLDTPLVYADTNRDNNIREIHFPVEPNSVSVHLRPESRPGSRVPIDHTGGTGRSEKDGEDDFSCEETKK